MKKNILLGLVVIIFIGIFLRFYQLGQVPNSLNWDEVSWGYNAYSIGMTGKDEYGVTFPLSFKAFGDFKQPVYVYLDAIPTLLFGLTGFAVRFPSAVFGSLTILSVFFLVRELFYKENKRDYLSLVVAALFAISPWSIQFSRVAFEANVGIFFTITGVAILLAGMRRNSFWQIALGSIIMSVSCYTYHSQKIFTPLLFGSIFLLNFRYWLKRRNLAAILLIVFLVANIFWLLDMRTTARGRSVLFTSNQTQLLSESTQRLIKDNERGDVLGKIIDNRRLVYTNIFFSNYLSHFNPMYLFLTGDNPRHHPPEMGDLYLVAFPFILLGMIMLWRKQRPETFIIFVWFLLAPVASSLAVDAPNASRSMVFLPIWDIFTGLGILAAISSLKKYVRPVVSLSIISLAFLISFVYYFHMYFVHTDLQNAYDWQYGYREAVQYVTDYQKKHEGNAFFASTFEQPYIFYLFYAHVDPREYISTGGSKPLLTPCFQIQKSYFGKCLTKLTTGDLYLSFDEVTDKHLAKLRDIHYPNDEIAIRIYKYQ